MAERKLRFSGTVFLLNLHIAFSCFFLSVLDQPVPYRRLFRNETIDELRQCFSNREELLMKTKIRRILAAAVSVVMVTGLMTVGAHAAELSYRDLNGVTWSYAGDGDTALESIRDSGQTVEQAQALLIPANVDGIPVDAVRSNGFDNVVVGHRANEYILLPEGIREVGGMTFYDFNYAKGVSIPASVTTVDYNAFDVLGREIRNATVIYGAAGSEAERWAGDNSTAVYPFSLTSVEPYLAGNDTIFGGEGDDVIINNNGDYATITGGAGADSLVNSNGSVLFQYATGDGNDTITGFNQDSTLKVTAGEVSNITSDGLNVFVAVGNNTITLEEAFGYEANILDAGGNSVALNFNGTDAAESLKSIREWHSLIR